MAFSSSTDRLLVCTVRSCCFALLLFGSVVSLADGGPQSTIADDATPEAYDFGRVLQGTLVEHVFRVENRTEKPFRLSRIDMTGGIRPDAAFREIPPGGSTELGIRLDTAAVATGPYRGWIALFGDGQKPHAEFALTGEILAPIRVEPRPAIFLVANRGEEKSKSVDLVNQEDEPLGVTGIQHPEERFSTRLETIEDGKRYRLVVSIKPDGPGGKKAESIFIRTSSPSLPEMRVTVFSYLRERVYTFPDVVDMGAIKVSDIDRDPELFDRLSQTLMVYNQGASDLKVSAESDLPFLEISAERGPQGDRYQLTVSLIRDGIRPGPVNGSIEISTNDAAFPRLKVPVTGRVIDE